MALIELMQEADGGDFFRSLAEAVLQLLMEADVDGLIGASRHERSAERASYARHLDSCLADVPQTVGRRATDVLAVRWRSVG